nr:MAG TPA: hypothetical protein [Bacteriophage sp.]
MGTQYFKRIGKRKPVLGTAYPRSLRGTKCCAADLSSYLESMMLTPPPLTK